jgi:hypothetical protein
MPLKYAMTQLRKTSGTTSGSPNLNVPSAYKDFTDDLTRSCSKPVAEQEYLDYQEYRPCDEEYDIQAEYALVFVDGTVSFSVITTARFWPDHYLGV